MFASVTATDGVYQPVYAVQGLAGATYEIKAAENIYTPDGTLRCSAGEVVDTVTTGADGTAESKPLYLGKYEITEMKAPDGMVVNKDAHTAELVYAGQEIEITKPMPASATTDGRHGFLFPRYWSRISSSVSA